MSSVEHKAGYNFHKYDQFVKLTLNPSLSDAPWGDIDELGRNVLGELDEYKTPAIMVDLSPLTYMGSAMVALIVRIWKVTKARSGQMVIVCANEMVLKVISLAGLDKVWKITPTLEQGYKELKVKPPGALGNGHQPHAFGNLASSQTTSRSGVVLSPLLTGGMTTSAMVETGHRPKSNHSGLNRLTSGQSGIMSMPESDENEIEKSASSWSVVVAILMTVAVLSLILGGVGLFLYLQVKSFPLQISQGMALSGAVLSMIGSFGTILMGGGLTIRLMGAVAVFAGITELIIAIMASR